MATVKYQKEITANTIRTIETKYNIEITHLEQLFLGADKDTFAYKIFVKNGTCYFLKIRTGDFNEASIIIPYLLYKKTGGHIIPPIKTIDDRLYIKTPEFTIILYPFIQGKSGKEIDLSAEQWIEFGKTLRIIHSFTELQLQKSKFSFQIENIPREKFDEIWLTRLEKIMDELDTVQTGNQIVENFINMLEARRPIITEMMQRAGKLLNEINDYETDYCMAIKYCLCHADIHAANILITENDFYIVDWDTMIMAPKERDLMFIGGGVAGKWNTQNETDLFYRGYGECEKINRKILDYYRYIRIIEDIVVYWDQFFADGVSDKNRESITEKVESGFLPGNVAEMAFKTDNSFTTI